MDIDRDGLVSYSSFCGVSEGCKVWLPDNNGRLEAGDVYRVSFHCEVDGGYPDLVCVKAFSKEEHYLIEYEHKGDGIYKVTTTHDPDAKDCSAAESYRDNEFSPSDIELFRQWFDSVQDLNPKFLEKKDYELAERIYKKLGIRVPGSMSEHLS